MKRDGAILAMVVYSAFLLFALTAIFLRKLGIFPKEWGDWPR